MKTSRTFKILFRQIKARRKNDTAPIYVRITVNGERTEFSLGKYHPIKQWDRKMSRAIGRSATARALNDELDTTYTEITEAYKELKKEGKHISAQDVKARYLSIDNNQTTLLELADYHKSKMEGILEKGTLKNYKTTTKYLNNYLIQKLKTPDVYLEQIDYSFIIDFEQFLRKKKNHLGRKPLANNGIMKHIDRINKLMNFAVKLKWIKENPFLDYDIKFNKYDSPFLSAIELQQLEEVELKKETHVKVRDIFVFGCYTGLSYIDVKNLTKNNVIYGIDGKRWITFYRDKSDIPTKVPLLNKALTILKKYSNYDHTNRLLPVYSNQKMNKYIKEVAVICGITKNLTCHVARYTFATTVTLSNGVPIETVSKLLGHTKLSTTQIYARVLEHKIGKDITQLQNVLNADTSDERNVS